MQAKRDILIGGMMYRALFIVTALLFISGCSSKKDGQSEIKSLDSKEEQEVEYTQSIFDKADWESDTICYNKSQLTQCGFERFTKDYPYSIHGNKTLYKIKVDYPQNGIPYASILQEWVREQIAKSVSFEKIIKYRKSGKGYSIEEIAEQTALCYFNDLVEEYNDPELVPSTLFMSFDLRLVDSDERTVTFQQYESSYGGGAHGYFSEELKSFDKQHNCAITNGYLFKSEHLNDVKRLFLDIVTKNKKFAEWEKTETMDDVKRHFMSKDEDGNMIDSIEKMILPDPGLSEIGLVYSYQPYDISCFAAGCFHFVIPYSKVIPFLSKQGKWCLERRCT